MQMSVAGHFTNLLMWNWLVDHRLTALAVSLHSGPAVKLALFPYRTPWFDDLAWGDFVWNFRWTSPCRKL